MIDVTNVDTSTTMAGRRSSLPIFIAPTGMSKLSHPRGEMCFAEAAGLEEIPFTVSVSVPQIYAGYFTQLLRVQVSTNAGAGLDEIVNSRGADDQNFFFQLYMNKDRPKSTTLLQKITAYRASQHPKNPRLFKAIIVTVDCPAPGKREPDERVKAEVELVWSFAPQYSISN